MDGLLASFLWSPKWLLSSAANLAFRQPGLLAFCCRVRSDPFCFFFVFHLSVSGPLSPQRDAFIQPWQSMTTTAHLWKSFFKKWFPQLWRFCLYLLTPLVLQTQSFLSVEHKRSHFKEWFCYFPITIHMKFIIAIDTFHVNCYWKINLSLTKG